MHLTLVFADACYGKGRECIFPSGCVAWHPALVRGGGSGAMGSVGTGTAWSGNGMCASLGSAAA